MLLGLSLLCLILGGCIGATSMSITTSAPNGTLEQIPATLLKPDGRGPFPAVVIITTVAGSGLGRAEPPTGGRGN
jgi:hypothetical protein